MKYADPLAQARIDELEEDLRLTRHLAEGWANLASRRTLEIVELTKERDLAFAHDTQPYPTAWAYEQACAALERAHKRIRELEERSERGPRDVLDMS